MAWVKIPIQEQWTNTNDLNASGFVIKCYLPGTTTVTPMAIDKNGVTTVTTATLNADGFPEVSGNEVALYIDRDFKIAIYQNASDAAANTNAFWGPVDNIKINSLLSDFQNGYWLADYTELRAIDPADYSADDVITLTDSGIAGSGVLRNVASHGLSDNGGTIIVINSNWYWERTYSPSEIYCEWFGASTSSSASDNSTAIQSALDFARSLTYEAAVNILDANFPNKGGVTVRCGPGIFSVNSFEIPETVSFICSGKTTTGFSSSYNGRIVSNKVTSGDGTFDKCGIRISGFFIKGDRAQSSQVALDTLRLFDCKIDDVIVYASGGDGIKLRQALTTSVNNCTALNCVGDGIVLDEGINFWATPTLSNLPSNANKIENCHAFFNDGAGLRIKGLANGNIVEGGSYEQNYLASGNNVGYNIHITATTFSENVLRDVWVEGAVEAHIYINAATSSSPVRISGLKHFGASTCNRAVIVDRGTCYIERAFGHGTAYPTINGSIRPFRINVGAGVAVLKVENCEGSTITNGNFVEDENGNTVQSVNQRTFNRFISGIDFDSTLPSSDPYFLDAYQEGTWSPTLTTDGTDFTSVTYDGIREGAFVKIGKMVFVSGLMRTDAVTVGSASGNVRIGGLPFTVGNVSTFSVGTSQAFATDHPEGAYAIASTTAIYLTKRSSANGATSLLAVADIATGADSNLVRFSGAYLATA